MGKRHGFGEITYQNGDVYKGNWDNDKYQGYGEYYFKDGRVYKGQWVDDMMHDANGTYTWPKGYQDDDKQDKQQYVG